MKNYKITLDYETELKAEDKEDAINKFMENIENEIQQTYMTFIFDNTKAKEIKE